MNVRLRIYEKQEKKELKRGCADYGEIHTLCGFSVQIRGQYTFRNNFAEEKLNIGFTTPLCDRDVLTAL